MNCQIILFAASPTPSAPDTRPIPPIFLVPVQERTGAERPGDKKRADTMRTTSRKISQLFSALHRIPAPAPLSPDLLSAYYMKRGPVCGPARPRHRTQAKPSTCRPRSLLSYIDRIGSAPALSSDGQAVRNPRRSGIFIVFIYRAKMSKKYDPAWV